ncbi:MAG: hypothetical protein KAS87_00895 [Candidatus Omnitrophica bacterium]|nr:hypothetical protein [Candidatus Omnitrophota bacterium]
MDNGQVKTTLKDIFGQYVAGLYNGRQAAEAIDDILDGIKGLVYKNTRCLSVDDGHERYSLNIAGLNKKQIRRVETDLVPVMHILRMQRGLGHGTEAHLGKGCSTKHHKGGFDYLVNRVAMQYGM